MNHLRLFGGAALDGDAGPVRGRAAQRHRIALLALLATTRRLYRSRDQLITLLWPETDTERGRKLLSDSIYRLNQALGGDVLVAIGDDLRLNRTQLECDAAALEAAYDAQDWKTVAELYRGEFLDGFFVSGSPDFDQWMDTERAHYQRMACKALEALATEANETGADMAAVEWWQRLAEIKPDDSRVSMELMRALEAAGNRAGALKHARVHESVLRETIGIAPDKAVLQLASQISRAQNANPALGIAIAVLPFTATNDADINVYFADGVSEELIFLLSRQRGLQVASRTSSFAYRGLPIDVRELARRLKVDWILEGSVRKSGDLLRVSAQLIDGRNGFQMWSESFERAPEDILSVQSDISSAVGEWLRKTNEGNAAQVRDEAPVTAVTTPVLGKSVADNRSTRTAQHRPIDAETYDLYLQARFHWHRRTEESLRSSVSLFERVLARDPMYARASAGLADAYAVMAFYDYLPPHFAFPRADAAARHAIQLDASLAGPHATLAYVDFYYRWNWDAAEEGFRKAIAIEPTYSTTHQWYANLLTACGRFAGAEATMRRAAELDPLSMIAHTAIARVMMYANQPQRAIEHLHRALSLDPGYCLSHYWMGAALIRNGQPELAIPYIERSLQLNAHAGNRSVRNLAGLARAHAETGNRTRATSILNELIAEDEAGRYVSSFQIGRIHAALGDTCAALDRFERAFAERAHSMAYLRIDPHLRPLIREPRFRTLLENLEGETETARVRLSA